MINLHYEMFNISAKAAEAMGLDSTQMVKLKFASNKSTVKLSTYDFNDIKTYYIPLLKQIPSGKRKFDAIDNVWTIPAAAFDVIRQLVEINTALTASVTKHKDLYKDYIFAANDTSSKTQKAWHETVREQASFEAEAAEDFFHQATTVTDQLDSVVLKERLIKIMEPYVTMPEDELVISNEWMMRAYKITARRLHPDIKGGDAQKMSELNSLWMQYKEIA